VVGARIATCRPALATTIAARFAYEETDDQDAAIEAVLVGKARRKLLV